LHIWIPDASRYEAVLELVRWLVGGEITVDMWLGSPMPFTDVPENHWAYGAVVLASNGYVDLSDLFGGADTNGENGNGDYSNAA